MVLSNIHADWRPILEKALKTLSPTYISELESSSAWLPGKEKIFNAFRLPKEKTRYILLGESPYPRAESANGYAFWDNAVSNIWDGHRGLSKAVNRATSLRNWIKMLLHANGALIGDFSQQAIAELDKSSWIQTLDDLFQNLLDEGFLLLNASLVLSERSVQKDVSAWRPFMASLLSQLADERREITVILLGLKAQPIAPLCHAPLECFSAEHPYQLSFITNPNVVDFFKPFDLLRLRKK